MVGKFTFLLIQLVVLLQLVGFATQAQEVSLPEDFYDPQLLAFGDWKIYSEDSNKPPVLDTELTGVWVGLDTVETSLHSFPATRWYRVDFTIGWHYRSRDIGLYLGSVEQAHEIYLNGRKIGGQGSFSPNAIDAAGKPSLTLLPQLGMWYSFMNLSRSNQLIIGVQGLTEPMQFDLSQIQIDDMDRLTLKARSEETVIKVVQGAAISILLLIASFCGFLFVSGLRGRANVIFGLFVLLAAILIFVDSLLFYDFGLRAAFLERAIIFGKFICIILLSRLILTEISGRFNPHHSHVEQMFGGLIGVGVFLSTAVPLRILDSFADVGAIILLSHTLWMCRSSFKLSNFELKLMLSLAAAALFATFYQVLFTSPNISLSVLHLCYLVTAFTFLFLIARRYQDMSRHLSALSERLVSVRDLERARMARDMHDGIGQGIAAVGLHLKILASGKAGIDIGYLTQSIDDLNVHLGEVIQDLRPSLLKSQTLGTAIERHLEQTLTDTKIMYDCAVDNKLEMPFELKEQLFRIYQEALNNAMKHAGCTGISVEMICVGRKLKLIIKDNGKGFSVGETRDLGLGLSTMRERASLVNAAYTLDSAIMHGTKVQMEVELDD